MIDSVYASSVEYCDQTKALMTFNDMDREEFCIAFLGALACSPCPCLLCQQRLHHREVGTLLGPGSRRCSAPMLRKNRWLDYWRHIYIYIELLQWYWEDYERKLALDIASQTKTLGHWAIGRIQFVTSGLCPDYKSMMLQRRPPRLATVLTGIKIKMYWI